MTNFDRPFSTRVPKKPEFLKPDPTRIFDPPRVPDPKKPEAKKAQPDPTRTRTSGFGFFRVLTRKTRIFIIFCELFNLMGGSRRETPIEINLRDFRRRRQSRKSIIMDAI